MPGALNLARERKVIIALARGVLGSAYVPSVPDEVLETVLRLPSQRDRDDLFRGLRTLDTKLGALALTGKRIPVSWLSQAEAEDVLRALKRSRVTAKQMLAGGIISASVAALYGHETPAWERIGYPGPLPPPADPPPRRFAPITIDADTHISCDVVIVGSGPGGGCVAAHLAKAGLDVLIVEKGAYFAEADFHHYESASHRDLYLYGATLATRDGGTRIIAGSTLGGGATVNYSISFETPPKVREQWARISGIDAFASGEYEDAQQEAARRLNVNRDSSALNPRERFMEEGLKRLGWHVDQMPRSVKDCPQDEQCGYCGFGCRVGAKQGPRVYLEEAVANGARIITRADIRKVSVRDGKATGVEGRSGRHRLTIDARKAVAVAAGAIETPALLLRSGLGGEVGKHLHLHPGAGIWGIFDDEARPWEGVQMSRYSDEARDWDDGYGPIFESVPMHPGVFATAVPWTSAAEHLEMMNEYRNTSLIGMLGRDKTEGRITIDKRGAPLVDYRLQADDERRLIEAVLKGARVFEEAGARSIRTTHTFLNRYEPGRAVTFESWADDVRRAGIKANNWILGSFHQIGSCRMGADPATSAVDARNESHEVNGLYVTDSSTFPDASGVNPMLSVFAIANRAGKLLAERLG
ncbi:MAG TPA: GMC family oxidoreductase [Actinomycetota bacterium]|nr:GMC family oxidoreductase [Actinomycetota bacterium]